jgi:hypothetical protein
MQCGVAAPLQNPTSMARLSPLRALTPAPPALPVSPSGASATDLGTRACSYDNVHRLSHVAFRHGMGKQHAELPHAG